MKNRYQEVYFSPSNRYSIGLDHKIGGYYFAIPVGNGIIDYDEQYHIERGEYDRFLADENAARKFAEECRDHRHDKLLIYPPSANRGSPI